MSMDDQYREMKNFQRALIHFNQRLSDSLKDLQSKHDRVSPHWQDEMRRSYDLQWQPLRDVVDQYVKREGPSYVEFLAIKAHALDRYLYGR